MLRIPLVITCTLPMIKEFSITALRNGKKWRCNEIMLTLTDTRNWTTRGCKNIFLPFKNGTISQFQITHNDFSIQNLYYGDVYWKFLNKNIKHRPIKSFTDSRTMLSALKDYSNSKLLIWDLICVSIHQRRK